MYQLTKRRKTSNGFFAHGKIKIYPVVMDSINKQKRKIQHIPT